MLLLSGIRTKIIIENNIFKAGDLKPSTNSGPKWILSLLALNLKRLQGILLFSICPTEYNNT